jgi:hypothetical protein
MRRGLLILTGVAVLVLLTGPMLGKEEAKDNPFGDNADKVGAKDGEGGGKAAKDADGGGKKPGKRKGGKDGPFGEKARPFGADVDEIDSKVTLTADQKEKLGKLKESRDKMLGKWDAANQKRLDLCEKRLSQLEGKDNKDPRVQNARKQLVGTQKSLTASRANLENGYARKMFSLLSPEQRGKWNGPILKGEMEKEFSLVFLEPAQQEKLEKLSDVQGRRLAVPVDPESEACAKMINSMSTQVYRSLLNAEQKKVYKKQKLMELQKQKEAAAKKGGGKGGR